MQKILTLMLLWVILTPKLLAYYNPDDPVDVLVSSCDDTSEAYCVAIVVIKMQEQFSALESRVKAQQEQIRAFTSKQANVQEQIRALKSTVKAQQEQIRAFTSKQANVQEQIRALESTVKAQQEQIRAFTSKQANGLLKSFKVGGKVEQFYPRVFRADGWDEGLLEIEIFHASENGKLVGNLTCHSSPHGAPPSFAEIHQPSQRWIADAWCDPKDKNVVVYLKGGDTDYSWRSGSKSVVLLDSIPWDSNQLAWLDSKPKTLMPAMDSPAAQFNRDEVYTFIPNSVEFLELESFSVGGEEGKFYPVVWKAQEGDKGPLEFEIVVWKAQEGDKGPLEFEIFHGSERGNLVSQFSCHFQQDKQSFAEIQQQSQRWEAERRAIHGVLAPSRWFCWIQSDQ
jgi:hypothetical protein